MRMGTLECGIKFPATASHARSKRVPNNPDGSESECLINDSRENEDTDDQEVCEELE